LVKKGTHKNTGKDVAIKIVKKKELTLKDKEMLKREIEVLKVCQHPNIIKLEDIFENQENIFIVMELLTGGDLFTYLEAHKFRLSEDRARKIVHQIAIALYYLHNFGIAHRDIKPENVLMVDD
jgi:serine/threonine protein kinase